LLEFTLVSILREKIVLRLLFAERFKPDTVILAFFPVLPA
jgi:hypothetical protein